MSLKLQNQNYNFFIDVIYEVSGDFYPNKDFFKVQITHAKLVIYEPLEFEN